VDNVAEQPALHIGFDVSQTGSTKAGCGYYAHALVKALLDLAPHHRYSLFPSFGDFFFDAGMPLHAPYAGRDVHYGPRHLAAETAARFWRGDALEDALAHPDLIHANNFWCPTQLASTRLVYTFYDLGFAVDPAWSTEANRVGCFDGVFRSAIAADWVVAISHASRAHYLHTFPHFPEQRIRVIHPCSRFADASEEGKRPRALDGANSSAFWLNVGTIEPRKNQRGLAESYARYLALGGAPLPLVFAGGKGWLMDEFQSHLRELGIAAHVIMTGYVTDAELIWLYRNCYANLYPSRFEGFGLPVLEGMQFGAPTIASNTTSIPEVSGTAAILLDPDDTEGWAQAMLRIAADREQRDRLATSARVQADRFDWKQSATELLALYDEAIAAPKRRVAA